MSPALWGLLSALSFGCADFIARFTSRGLGPGRSLFGILIVSGVILTAYVVAQGLPPRIRAPAVAGRLARPRPYLGHAAALLGPGARPHQRRGPGCGDPSGPDRGLGTHARCAARRLQWAGMAAACWVPSPSPGRRSRQDRKERPPGGSERAPLRKTIAISLATSAAYAAYVVLGQARCPTTAASPPCGSAVWWPSWRCCPSSWCGGRYRTCRSALVAAAPRYRAASMPAACCSCCWEAAVPIARSPPWWPPASAP